MFQYPTIFDLEIYLFVSFLVLGLILRRVEGLMVLVVAVVLFTLSTALMWLTWMTRFSGNANFFYFQTCLFNFALIIIFTQIYKAIDKKRKKYSSINSSRNIGMRRFTKARLKAKKKRNDLIRKYIPSKHCLEI